MQAIELQSQLIEEIKRLPLEKIPEIYDLIHYFRLGVSQEKNIELSNYQARHQFLEDYIHHPIKLNHKHH